MARDGPYNEAPEPPVLLRSFISRPCRAVQYPGRTVALRTRLTDLLGLEHPVILGGMGRGATVPPMVAAVSEAGGLGVLGVTRYPPERVAEQAAAVRSSTSRPFGLNLLLFSTHHAATDVVLAQQPPHFWTAWAWPEQDLRGVFDRAHAAGARGMHMVAAVDGARRAGRAA